jgi:hypothetical protein
VAKIELLIKGSKNTFEPVILDGITWETERKGSPSKLTFTCIKDGVLAFEHGNQVQLKVDGKGVFMGFVFEKTRDKEQHIEVTCYDQLRYFKNKETYFLTNKTASQMLKAICSDFNLKTGFIADTSYVAPKIAKDDSTLFDIMQEQIDRTVAYTNKLFCLYDDFGKITLKNVEDMKTNVVVDVNNTENFEYTSSIDSDTYNVIKLYRDNEDTGKREVYEVRDYNNVGNWGILKLTESLQEGENGKAKAEAYLKLKNRVTRTLKINGCFGDLSVRAGSSVYFTMNLGDKIIKNYLVCERVTHYFNENNHTMDLELIGGNLFYG